MYKVIKEFADLQDGKRVYRVGDDYPRKGGKTTLERTAELMGDANKIGVPLIEYIEDEPIMPEPIEPTIEEPVKATKRMPRKKQEK